MLEDTQVEASSPIALAYASNVDSSAASRVRTMIAWTSVAYASASIAIGVSSLAMQLGLTTAQFRFGENKLPTALTSLVFAGLIIAGVTLARRDSNARRRWLRINLATLVLAHVAQVAMTAFASYRGLGVAEQMYLVTTWLVVGASPAASILALTYALPSVVEREE